MNDASCGSAYDSASSRAQAPHAGAALKSTSTGLCCVLAWLSAASMSLFHETVIFVLLKLAYSNREHWMPSRVFRSLFCFFLQAPGNGRYQFSRTEAHRHRERLVDHAGDHQTFSSHHPVVADERHVF